MQVKAISRDYGKVMVEITSFLYNSLLENAE